MHVYYFPPAASCTAPVMFQLNLGISAFTDCVSPEEMLGLVSNPGAALSNPVRRRNSTGGKQQRESQLGRSSSSCFIAVGKQRTGALPPPAGTLCASEF